ncbi:metallophosphoesterase family protein [Butyrivibrio sp. MC2021]|uniref:metallophosphoesterase family protein n=1 Tax=Butyrivibrio sp. MC2021 TaxID=1408306 RepID=UPI0012DE544A|nr:metallophosphoesterase family protein [Butyrivibrio sp. MC2021]
MFAEDKRKYKAEELFSRSEYGKIVCLGDLVDDWDQEKNLGLYSETFDALERFINRHPNFLLCYGNHDVSYIWEARESGYSDYARRVVIEGLSKLEKCVSAGDIALMIAGVFAAFCVGRFILMFLLAML